MKVSYKLFALLLPFALLLAGFFWGFAGKGLLRGDIFALGIKPVIAAENEAEAETRHLLWEAPLRVEPQAPAEENPAPVYEVDLANPRVMIYCTHNAESYRPSFGVDKSEGKNAGIFQVATSLYEGLLANGISAVLCDTIHDYPDWSKSYAHSLASIEEYRELYPSLEVFIDVHRDAPSVAINSTVLRDGAEYAKLMLVVGSAERIEHPTWERNLAFAKEIGNALDASCAGILRGVKVQGGRYNQHVSNQSILVEMGTNLNTLEQAQNTALLLADVLGAILREKWGTN